MAMYNRMRQRVVRVYQKSRAGISKKVYTERRMLKKYLWWGGGIIAALFFMKVFTVDHSKVNQILKRTPPPNQ